MDNSVYPKGSRENPYTIEEFDNYPGEWPGGYVKDWGYVPREATGTYNPSSSSSSSDCSDEWSYSSNSSDMSIPSSGGGAPTGDVISTSCFRGYNGDKTGCRERCEEMLACAGCAPGGKTPIRLVNGDGAGNPTTVAGTFQEGIDYIFQQLRRKRPVIVGVHYKPGKSMNDGVGDHFIIIVGFNGSGFHYFDPATSYLDRGTSSTLVLFMKDGMLKDPANPLGKDGKKREYVATSVRFNQE